MQPAQTDVILNIFLKNVSLILIFFNFKMFAYTAKYYRNKKNQLLEWQW